MSEAEWAKHWQNEVAGIIAMGAAEWQAGLRDNHGSPTVLGERMFKLAGTTNSLLRRLYGHLVPLIAKAVEERVKREMNHTNNGTPRQEAKK